MQYFHYFCADFCVFMEKISKAYIKQIKSLQQKKFRDELGLFVAEGDKCVSELTKGFECVSLFREGENATRTEIEQMSSLRTPQGVIGVFKKPASQHSPLTINPSPLTLVLDGIQDPGNLGTIIRTCDWFGVHTIVCSPDTADCFNPKVVQATMGALARVHLIYTDLPAWLATRKEPIFGTLLDGKNMYETPVDPQQSAILIMGNEGNGISTAVRPLITHPIRIPSFPPQAETSESLNVAVATAVVLAEFRRLSTKGLLKN